MTSRATFTCEIKVGRVIEARVQTLKTPADARAYSNALARVVTSFSKTGAKRGPVLCADHRPVVIYAPEVADELARLFSEMNAYLVRVGIIAARSNATLSMQLGRIVREANNPLRQIFYEPGELTDFLAHDLDRNETERVRAFLAT